MQPFYRPAGPGRFPSTSSTAGPWAPTSSTAGRFTMDLLGPVPVGPLRVEASVVRPGRSVELREALLVDDAYHAGRGRTCARCSGC